MEEKFYTCKYDRAFKEVFLNENNKDLLKALIESILDIKINNIEIGNNERNVGSIYVKRKYVDAIIYTDNGIIGIEINSSMKGYIRPRNFSYIANIYSHYIEVGEDYSEEMDIIQINLNYGIKDRKLIREYKVIDGEGKEYIKNLKIYEINMDKCVNFWYTKDKEKIDKYKYLIMLDLEDKELKDLSKEDKVVNKFMNQLEIINKLPKWDGFISEEEDQRKIRNTWKKQYKKEGLEEGRIEGRKEG
ncbi:MAG: PD-(D/E)XK nuclease family transposase, partial [Bacilli bacterium]|nr:PD-(D/E)XK nuclease family transposase [Bacilli bacterium]